MVGWEGGGVKGSDGAEAGNPGLGRQSSGRNGSCEKGEGGGGGKGRPCGGAEEGRARPGQGETAARGCRRCPAEPRREQAADARGLPAPPAPGRALPFGGSGVWEEAEPRAGQPSGEMGGTAASQKTGTGGRKQVGKEGAGRELGRGGGVGEVGGRRTGPHSLGAEPPGLEGEE